MDKILNIIKQSFISFSGEILVKILGFFFKLYLVHNLLDSTLSLGIFIGIALYRFYITIYILRFLDSIFKISTILGCKKTSKKEK